jgi:MFS family permease
VAGACFGTLITFTQPYALARGAERVSGYLIGYTLGALFVRVGLGGMADRFGHRRVAQLSLATYGMVAIGTSCLTPSWIVPFGVGFGLSHGFLYPALAALAAEGSNPERRGRALSAFNAYFNLGAGLALVGCGWLARVAGYPAVFVLVGALTTLSVVALKLPSAGPLTPPRSRAPTR